MGECKNIFKHSRGIKITVVLVASIIIILSILFGILYGAETEVEDDSTVFEGVSSASFPSSPEIRSYIGIFDESNFG